MTMLMRRDIDSSSSNSTSTATLNDANSSSVNSSTTEDGSAEGINTPTETNNTTTEVISTTTTSTDQITTTADASPIPTTAMTTHVPAETTMTDDSPALPTTTAAVANNITPGTYTESAAAATTTSQDLISPALSTTATTQDSQQVQSPTAVMISSSASSGSSQPIFTSSLCGSNSLCVADPIVTATSNDNSVTASNISIVQIVSIVIGVVFFLVLVGACLLIRRKRRNEQKNGLNYSSRRVSPFLYLHDEDQEKGTDDGKAIDNSVNGFGNDSPYKNYQPSKFDGSGILGEGDNIFYSNNVNYHRGSFYMSNSSVINEKISTPAESYSNRNTKDMMATATSLYPYIKRIDNNPYHQLNSTTSTINSNNDDKEVSLDTDNYTLSAMQIFRSSSSATANTRTRINSYISNTSSSNHGSLPRKNKIYRPSLHDSMFLGSTTSNSRHNSHHQRQESSLDPHIFNNKQEHKQLSLWDDHLVITSAAVEEQDAWSSEDRQSMMVPSSHNKI